MPLAIVTGAASGMGEATALKLTSDGWTVLALDRAKKTGGPVETVAADVTDRAGLERVIGEFAAQHGPIDLVANIAGVYPPSTLDTFTEEQYRLIFDVNVLGILNVTAASVPHMADGSAVVNFASVDAFTVSPGQLLYGASKAAVVMLTKELALELAPRGIRVNGVAPGWVDTPGNAATGRMAEAAAGIPLGRVAQPSEIAGLVAFLGSKEAAFVSGETLVASGADVMR